jgi:hypothetical protein
LGNLNKEVHSKNETVKDEPGERHIITGFSKNE